MVEPFELAGKTVKEAYYRRLSWAQVELVVEFTDLTVVSIRSEMTEDEITGHAIPCAEIEIKKIG